MLLVSALWSLLVYVPVAHWVWGGGWLQQLGVARLRGRHRRPRHRRASPALVAALVRRQAQGLPDDAHARRTACTLSVVGAGMLWVGWFGFNAGSALAANGTAGMTLAGDPGLGGHGGDGLDGARVGAPRPAERARRHHRRRRGPRHRHARVRVRGRRRARSRSAPSRRGLLLQRDDREAAARLRRLARRLRRPRRRRVRRLDPDRASSRPSRSGGTETILDRAPARRPGPRVRRDRGLVGRRDLGRVPPRGRSSTGPASTRSTSSSGSTSRITRSAGTTSGEVPRTFPLSASRNPAPSQQASRVMGCAPSLRV